MGRETNDRGAGRGQAAAQVQPMTGENRAGDARAARRKVTPSAVAQAADRELAGMVLDRAELDPVTLDQASVDRSGDKSADLWLGQQLRVLRRGRGLSLVELADRTGLSIGNISQIERGVSSPSVRSLKKLSEALQVSIGDLFQDTDLPPASEIAYIVRKKTRPLLKLGATGVQKELLTPTTPGALQMLMVTIAPGGSSGPDHYTHRGEESGLVLAGALELWIEDECFILKEGDTFRFKSTQPHRFANAGANTASVLWVQTPPGY
ncbi:MAG TPA: cupin domain-containing protein [Terriglobales bacterium]|nr:cupin domain-containing protein [Terriglobales bacterium]